MGEYGKKPSEEKMNAIEELRTSVMFVSRFEFLKDQNCWRPGDLHTVLGMQGSGKSSLIRSLIIEAAYHIPILGFLSEETSNDIWYELRRSMKLLVEDGKAGGDIDPLDNITLISETDDECLDLFKDQKEVLAFIRRYIIKSKCKLFILDNITTSQWYRTLADQESFVYEFKKMAKSLGIPVLIVAHTNKTFAGNTFMRSGDIRGNNMLAMLAEHFYCFNNVLVTDEITGRDEKRVVLQTEKHRGIDRDNYFFGMNYEKSVRLYTDDTPINKETAKALMKFTKKSEASYEKKADTLVLAPPKNAKKDKYIDSLLS